MKNRIRYLLVGGILFFFLSALLGVMLGSTRLSLSEIASAFTGGFDASPESRIVGYVRLPRTLAALFCGGALAVSGGVIQGVLQNPLASPSIIGVNAGAGLAVTLCTALGIYGGFSLSLFAFLGAFLTVTAVALATRRLGASKSTVILLGVAANSLLGALSDTVRTFLPEVAVLSNDFRIGEFSAVSYQKLIPAALIMLAALLVLLTLHNDLDVLTLGEDGARGLGMNTALMRTLFLLLAALLAGCAVCLCGLLSFVGLLVPHAIRRIAGSASLPLFSLCALYGGGFVCLCDTAARTVFAPYEIPVGILMAFLGAPFFVYILVKRNGGKV